VIKLILLLLVIYLCYKIIQGLRQKGQKKPERFDVSDADVEDASYKDIEEKG